MAATRAATRRESGVGRTLRSAADAPVGTNQREDKFASGATIEPMSDIAPGPSTRVLVADDEENQRAGLSKMIQSWGFSVETAADGQEALDKLSSMAVHVLVTDLMMPRLDGFELLKRLGASGNMPPAIVLTAFG